MKIINIVKLIGIGIMATNIAHANMNQAEFEELCELAGGEYRETHDSMSCVWPNGAFIVCNHEGQYCVSTTGPEFSDPVPDNNLPGYELPMPTHYDPSFLPYGGDTKNEQLDAFSLIEQFVKTKVIRDLLAK